MNRTQFTLYSEKRRAERAGAFVIERQDATHFTLNQHPYVLVADHRGAFDPAALADRFSTVLSKYDYIVGDWGFDQLRLRGFYAPENRLYTPERGVATIQDYLVEDCNFGCAYFVIQNEDVQIPRYLNRSKKRTGNKDHTANSRNHEKGRPKRRVRRIKSGKRTHRVTERK